MTTSAALDRSYTETRTGSRIAVHAEAHAQDFVLDTRREGSRAVLVVRGELDIATAPLVRSALGAVCARFPLRVEIDLSGVTFMDSCGLAVLDDARRSTPAGRVLALRDPSPSARRILALTGLDAAFEVTTTPGRPAARRAS